MGTSYAVYGYKDVTEEFGKMRDVYYACEAAGLDIPEEVEKFFNENFDGAYPSDVEDEHKSGLEVDLTYAKPSLVKEFRIQNGTAYEVDLQEIDPKIKRIRFTVTC